MSTFGTFWYRTPRYLLPVGALVAGSRQRSDLLRSRSQTTDGFVCVLLRRHTFPLELPANEYELLLGHIDL